jgi:hypothetical protein
MESIGLELHRLVAPVSLLFFSFFFEFLPSTGEIGSHRAGFLLGRGVAGLATCDL